MSKIFLFFILTYLFGNPFIALLVILLIIYFVDRKFVGLFPNLLKPWQRYRQMRLLKREIELNPHHARNKLDLGNFLLEKKRYRQALPYLQSAAERLDDQAEAQYALGLALTKLGEKERGIEQIHRALEMNPRLRYGEPYLQLAGYYRQEGQPDLAKEALFQFHQVNTSSSEAYYRLGELHRLAGEKDEARSAYDEAITNYRTSPKFKRKSERRWALLSWIRKTFG
jgi:tetratricopeptide (TPR) repeat protein